MNEVLLTVEDLSVRLMARDTWILRDVSLTLQSGRVLGIVGGSGSGKTTLGLALLRLLPAAMVQAGGRVMFQGGDIAGYSPARLRALRGGLIGTVFQEPAAAFDPLYTIQAQITETLCAHESGPRPGYARRVEELLTLAGVPDPARVAGSYPFELSGGLLQRAMIAQAVACSPQLLIADEPTSSLDVRVQARVMELFMRLKERLGLGIILITHDLGLVRHFADDVIVLHKGQRHRMIGDAESNCFSAARDNIRHISGFRQDNRQCTREKLLRQTLCRRCKLSHDFLNLFQVGN